MRKFEEMGNSGDLRNPKYSDLCGIERAFNFVQMKLTLVIMNTHFETMEKLYYWEYLCYNVWQIKGKKNLAEQKNQGLIKVIDTKYYKQ